MAISIENPLLVLHYKIVELHFASFQHRFPLISLHVIVESEGRFLFVEELLLG